MTDLEITQSLRNNSHNGMVYLYNQNYKGLCTYALKFTHNKEAAEETVQLAFLKLWEGRNAIDIKESFTAYLFRSVKNNCLNYIKHQQIVNRHNESVLKQLNDIENHLTLSQETGLSIYLAKELETKITEAVEKLPEQCREIFKMSRFEGLKHNEIADKKGITLNTVQKQISIALEKLKTELSQYLTIFITIMVKLLNNIS